MSRGSPSRPGPIRRGPSTPSAAGGCSSRVDAVHLDAIGSQPAVYHAESGTVASSPGLIDAEDDAGLVAAFDVVARDGWYPFGLTPKRGVKRLLPNHALDLGTFEARRHHAGPEPGSVATAEAARVVVHAAGAVGAAFGHVGFRVGLTAGRDSRLLLAALRPHLRPARFVTSRSGGRSNAVDVQVARRLAGIAGVRHHVVDRRPASEAELAAWLDQVGHVRAGSRGTYAPREPVRGVMLNGAAGEVARAYYRDGDRALGPRPSSARRRLPGAQRARPPARPRGGG